MAGALAVGGVGGVSGAPSAGSTGVENGGAAGTPGGGTSGGGASNGGAATGGAGGAVGVAGMFGVYDPADPPKSLELKNAPRTHDPVVIQSGSTYYLFHTGRLIPVKRSTDELKTWQNAGSVFTSNPPWIAEQVDSAGKTVTDLWAPDISFFGGSFHLYYSASTFGSNRSCIGHATRASLETGSWSDQGPVICSNVTTGNEPWNAIDPNVVLDASGTPWLAFGSFWDGLKLIRLNASGARDGAELLALATRSVNSRSIEAPFIVRRGAYYYLFASFDFCCRGADSTYRTMVGRSAEVQGPYVDKAGVAMLQGGGSLVLEGNSVWRGPGHNAVLVRGAEAFNVYHAYAASGGAFELRIAELVWDAEGWPISAGP